MKRSDHPLANDFEWYCYMVADACWGDPTVPDDIPEDIQYPTKQELFDKIRNTFRYGTVNQEYWDFWRPGEKPAPLYEYEPEQFDRDVAYLMDTQGKLTRQQKKELAEMINALAHLPRQQGVNYGFF